MHRLKAALPLLLLLSIGAVLYFSGVLDLLEPSHVVASQHRLQTLIVQWPRLARLAAIGLMALGVATGLPGTIVVVLACGFLFGTLQATVYCGIGLVAGSVVLFLASRHAFGNGRRNAPALVEHIRSGYLRHPVSYTFFLRLVPVFPFGGVSIALAWLRCPLWLFVLASGVAGSIMLVFETAIGAGLAQHLTAHHRFGLSTLLEPAVVAPIVALAVMALVPVLVNWLLARREKRADRTTTEQRHDAS